MPSHSIPARALIFLAAMGFIIVTPTPFVSLSEADAKDAASGGGLSIVFLIIGLIMVTAIAAVCRQDRPALRALRRWPYLALAACIVVFSVASIDPLISIRRGILALSIIATAAAMPLLPRGRSQLALLLAAPAGLAIALSYFGVLFLPELSIHQEFDITGTSEMVGDWRGIYWQKNQAALSCGMFTFIGFFALRTGQQILGGLLLVASLVFLYFTHGKTSALIWLPAFLLPLIPYSRLWGGIALAPLIILNALGVGAQGLPGLKRIAQALPLDSTFTGRTDVWAMALGKVEHKPAFGYGFDAFWSMPETHYNAELGWSAVIGSAHNSYLEAALSMGLVGMLVMVAAFIVLPLTDIAAASRRGADRALLTLFAQIWLFAIWSSSLESVFFQRLEPNWFLFLFAIFGLRYLATFKSVE